jgi:AraC family transcriptional activator of mtrCDE
MIYARLSTEGCIRILEALMVKIRSTSSLPQARRFTPNGTEVSRFCEEPQSGMLKRTDADFPSIDLSKEVVALIDHQFRKRQSEMSPAVLSRRNKSATSPRAAEDEEIVKPLARISSSDLDNLLMTLEVESVKLAECVVSSGWRLRVAATDAPCIHYNLIGMGRMIVGNHAPIDLPPHTLTIVPAGQSFCIEVGVDKRHPATLTITEDNTRTFAPGALRRFIAGSGEPEVILFCGYFRATYGASIDLFRTLTSPIVEQFMATDQLDRRLSSAIGELVAQEVGTGAMTAALMKQVLVTLLRRSLTTINLWAERFSMLGDPQIARVFAQMVTCPELPHSIESLAQTAGLSRSAFMARFTRLFGKPPKATLRDLRMRQAVVLLTNSGLSLDRIVYGVGYTSRSSFSRAFRKIHGSDPSECRNMRNVVGS